MKKLEWITEEEKELFQKKINNTNDKKKLESFQKIYLQILQFEKDYESSSRFQIHILSHEDYYSLLKLYSEFRKGIAVIKHGMLSPFMSFLFTHFSSELSHLARVDLQIPSFEITNETFEEIKEFSTLREILDFAIQNSFKYSKYLRMAGLFQTALNERQNYETSIQNLTKEEDALLMQEPANLLVKDLTNISLFCDDEKTLLKIKNILINLFLNAKDIEKENQALKAILEINKNLF